MDLMSLATALTTLIGAALLVYKAKDDLKKIVAERERVEAERGKIESERENIEACASEKITQTAIALIAPLREQVGAQGQEIKALKAERELLIKEMADQGQRITALEEENAELWKGVGTLTQQIEALGERPAWKPNATKKRAPVLMP